MQTRNITVLVTAAALGLVFACTVKTEGPSTGNNNRDGGSSSGNASSSGNSSSGDSGSTTNVDPQVCKEKSTAKACEECCGLSEETTRPFDEAYVTCICDEACKTECGSTLCAETGGEPDAACDACIEREDRGCSEKGYTECDKDAKCKAFFSCIDEACVEKYDAGQ